MKIYIISDMEGITGVSHRRQTKPDTPEYKLAQQLLMGDLLAVIEGAHDGGAEEVVIYDLHESGKNILLEQLPPYVKTIVGKPPATYGTVGINESYSGLILVGNHAKTYTDGAIFPHAYSILDGTLSVNGMEIGEIGMEAMIAGTYGVPLIMVTGDAAAEMEAKSLCAETETAVVKYAAGFGTAMCCAPSYTRKLLYEKAKTAVEHCRDISPLMIDAPYEIQLRFSGEADERLIHAEKFINNGDGSFALRGTNLHQMWDTVNLVYCDWLD